MSKCTKFWVLFLDTVFKYVCYLGKRWSNSLKGHWASLPLLNTEFPWNLPYNKNQKSAIIEGRLN